MTGRERLRAATAEIHERLHGLPPFVALLDGRLSKAGYRDLLARLWGFHAALDEHLSDGRAAPTARTGRLYRDLVDLGLSPRAIDALPRVRFRGLEADGPMAIGAAYVQEGSVLGGATLARALDPVLGVGRIDGRRFLTPAPGSGGRWRACLASIDREAADPAALPRMIAGALATFDAFEAHLLDPGPVAAPTMAVRNDVSA